jgi:hypothetical protein
MELFETINSHRYLYLLELSEPDDNVLRVVVAEGRPQSPDLSDRVGPASGYGPIVADDRSATYELQFESYVA